jgi:8-hydroxy-5-deazaflavin:NADPH oxidoreductase
MDSGSLLFSGGMKIGIIGSGMVGQSLARGYLQHGHDVRIGTRDGSKPELAAFDTGPTADVATWADLVVICVAGTVTEDLARELAPQLAGKVVVDTTNPLDFSSGKPGLFVGWNDSLGERVQRAAPEAKVVKAYNIVGNGLMVDPEIPGGPPTMFIAGDDEAAKATVTQLLTDTGWEVADLGGIDASRLLEPMCIAWVAYSIATGARDHAFKMLTS